LKIPPTRDHHQLARWINAQKLVDVDGQPVHATVNRVTTNTDTRVAGTRFRRIGRGRRGLLLEVWRSHPSAGRTAIFDDRLFRHESSGTYRRHAEARAWIAQNLRVPADRG
jgi:hypothetical protein